MNLPPLPQLPFDLPQAWSSLTSAQLLALAAAVGWASGLRLYLVVFLLGFTGFMGWLPLPPGLQLLASPWVMGASGLMLFIEFFADKIPGLDSLWDAVHTFIRIPAGAALAAGMLGTDSQTWGLMAALMGGTLAATAHAAKASTRAVANTSPEPFSNIALSLGGDALVPSMLWLAYASPLYFFGALAVLLVLMVVLIVVLFRFLSAAFRRLFGGRRLSPAS